jgi:hypothetical protein
MMSKHSGGPGWFGAGNDTPSVAAEGDVAKDAIGVNGLSAQVTWAGHPGLAKLTDLSDNWDGEGAPAPLHEAIVRADSVVRWALETGLVATDFEADVLGGVDIVLRDPGTSGHHVWVSCMNGGADTIVLSRGADVCGLALWNEGEAKTRVTDFLMGGLKRLHVPEDFVIYKCKISGGRVIDIPLPPKLTQSDVRRLYAFLQTQVDDEKRRA